MKLCILENDVLDPGMAPHLERLAGAFENLFRQAGANWQFDAYNTTQGEYPETFDAYDAVLLTGSRADAFSDAPWVVELRRRVAALLEQRKKIIGVCFGHQLLGVVLGAKVGRAPQGWGAGRMAYRVASPWKAPLATGDDGSTAQDLALLASHQDQVLELPSGARLMATSDFCPVAGFAVDDYVFSVQPHPEMDEIILGNLIEKRRHILGEERYAAGKQSLQQPHDGVEVARMMVAFVEGQPVEGEPA
jgi:GMP synthase-like glutamine amidotransferase